VELNFDDYVKKYELEVDKSHVDKVITSDGW